MKRLRIWESEIYLIEAGKGKERKGKEREGKRTLGYTSEPHACYFLFSNDFLRPLRNLN